MVKIYRKKKDRKPTDQSLFSICPKDNMIITNSSKKIKSLKDYSLSSIKKFYSDTISTINLSLITCPYCGQCHWAFHATYERKLDIGHRIITFDIQRIICMTCKHTHAILLDCMIPYAKTEADIIIHAHNDYHFSKAQHFDNINYYLFCVLSKRSFSCIFYYPHNFSLSVSYNVNVIQNKGGIYICI